MLLKIFNGDGIVNLSMSLVRSSFINWYYNAYAIIANGGIKINQNYLSLLKEEKIIYN